MKPHAKFAALAALPIIATTASACIWRFGADFIRDFAAAYILLIDLFAANALYLIIIVVALVNRLRLRVYLPVAFAVNAALYALPILLNWDTMDDYFVPAKVAPLFFGLSALYFAAGAGLCALIRRSRHAK